MGTSFRGRAAECKGIATYSSCFANDQQGTSLLLIDHAFNAASPDTIIRMIDEISRSSSNGPSGYNVTDLPESLLLRRGTVPLFTIRDPRITVPATFRVLGDMDLPHGSGRPNFTVSASPLWIRNLYNYFTSKGIEPLIVDADDFLANPDLVKELCAKLGLDAKELLWSWPKPTADERAGLHPHFYASQRALIESEGIRPELASINRDLDAEKKAWKIDFGEDASMVEEMIDLALPHYQWLKDRAFGKADVAAIK